MLEVITSDVLGVRHGFFTRKGGASSGIFAGLNCGTGSTDQSEVVAINRARVADWVGVDQAHLLTVHQIHSATAIAITAPPLPGVQADAMVTATPGLALGILTADCQPVLFADARAKVIGVAHAGWRGSRDGVLESTLTAMQALGAHLADITAVIGPCISQAAYEVGPEFLASLTAQDPAATRFFAKGAGDRLKFNLPAYGLHRLTAAGVGRVLWTGHCTYEDATRFYSYRRTTHAGEADYGRLISVIRL